MCDHNDHENPKPATWDEVKATMREMLKDIRMDRDTENPQDAYYPHQRAILGVNQVRSEPSSRYQEMTEEEQRLWPFWKDHKFSDENTVTIQCVKHRRNHGAWPDIQMLLVPPPVSRKVFSPFKITPKDASFYAEVFQQLREKIKEPRDPRHWFIFDSYVDFSDVRPVGEPLCVDESYRLNDRSELTEEEKEYLQTSFPIDQDPEDPSVMDLLRTCLPTGAVEIAPDLFYLPVEAAPGEIDQRIAALPTDRDDDDDDMVPIGNGQYMKRGEVRKALAKANQAVLTGNMKSGAQGLSLRSIQRPAADTQSLGRIFRDKPVEQMTDDELIGELTTDLYRPTSDELDAIEYPMPGHLWTLTKSHPQINAAVLKATTRCLWVKVELTPDCPEVHVMNREQFRSFLTNSGEHEDWKTRRPNWRDPQTSDDVLRYNLTTTTYTGVDELLQHMIEYQFPYIEHTPV